jgi:hypothetical protein
MQHTIAASLAVAKEDTRLKHLPEWIDRFTCELQPIAGSRPGMRLCFHCDCTLDKRVRVKANKPVAGWDDNKIATMLRDAVLSSEHSSCADRSTATATAAAAPTDRERQLEAAVKAGKRKLVNATSKNELLQAQVDSAAAAKKACTDASRQESLAAQRRVDIDIENKEGFTAANKHTAMHADRTGLKATVLYWAGGSIEKVFEMLLAVMAAFGLRQRMADELKVQAEGTSASIVSRLHGALAILQGCKNEEQRQHYRVVLTAAAPVPVAQGDSTGLEAKFADELGINRTGKPLKDSVWQRVQIDADAEKLGQPLAVGDTVVCRHGTGTLVEYDGPDKPCAIKICNEGVEHTSEFDCAKKCKGGGSVRRAPISFAHPARAARKDKLPDVVKKQVLVGTA